MNGSVRVAILAAVCMLFPFFSHAQDSWAQHVKSLHSVLDELYDQMLPMCSNLISVGRGIAGFAAMWYIAARVWGHLSRAESIDFYPLFRPFVLGFAIMIFPSVIALINGVMQPTVNATSGMVNNTDQAIAALLKKKEAAVKSSDVWQMYVGETGEGNSDEWYKYTHPDDPNRQKEDWLEGIGNEVKFAMSKAYYNFRNSIKEVISEVLQLLFAAVSLCINTMRTFNLLILAILGPLVFGLSVFDGFQHTLKHWMARYINVFLWLPIANIFGAVIGKIQENMLQIDIAQIGQAGDTFFSRTDAGYLIFLIIGILGYTTVPNIANYIMWVGGGDALTGKMTAGTAMAASAATSGAMMAGGGAMAAAPGAVEKIGAGISNAAGAAGSAFGHASQYMRNKLSGHSKVD